ncbi:putative tripeptidyl-peptidase II [Dioscorea sansibarensis]
MAPNARLAVYKVCWAAGCFGSDILAAMDRAVSDGCHVLSLSLGGGITSYYLDNVAVGAFSAMEHGVFVSCSAGNDGPTASSLSNVAPWVTTVGAGTLDRDFPATVYFNHGGVNFTGVSLYKGKPLPSSRLLPFVYAGNVSNGTDGNLCLPGTLNPSLVAGKIVLCDRGGNARVEKGYVVKSAGGAGMVLANMEDTGEELIADAHLLPAVAVGVKARNSIMSYFSSNPHPTATIVFSGTKVGIRPSPVVAAFSSRGPNAVTPEILKPDLIAPGVNILAAWSGSVGPTGLRVDTRRVEFNIISGTSMSCPHVSGLAALIKGAHPEWSPAAIKSALMTTAYVDYAHGDGGILDAATLSAATPFDYGSGHVDPVRALDPGLVYDLGAEDYLDFLCALGYTPEEIATVAKRKGFKCDGKRTYAVTALNYPSFAVAFETATWSDGGGGGVGTTSTITHVRTLTNVGPAGTYKVKMSSDKGVKAKVEPEVLVFKKKGQRMSYKVSFTAGSQPSGSTGFGRLEWTDGKHVVASPIAYTWT